MLHFLVIHSLEDVPLVDHNHEMSTRAHTTHIPVPRSESFGVDLATIEKVGEYHATVGIDIVPVTKTTKLLLSSRVPTIEGTHILNDVNRMYNYAKSGDILLLELSSAKLLEVGSLANTPISHEDTLECFDR